MLAGSPFSRWPVRCRQRGLVCKGWTINKGSYKIVGLFSCLPVSPKVFVFKGEPRIDNLCCWASWILSVKKVGVYCLPTLWCVVYPYRLPLLVIACSQSLPLGCFWTNNARWIITPLPAYRDQKRFKYHISTEFSKTSSFGARYELSPSQRKERDSC